MGSFLEAAICARVKPKICYVQKERKCEILFSKICVPVEFTLPYYVPTTFNSHLIKSFVFLDEIKDLVFKKKVLIACENSAEANDVGEYLKRAGIDCVVADEYTTTDQRKGLACYYLVS